MVLSGVFGGSILPYREQLKNVDNSIAFYTQCADAALNLGEQAEFKKKIKELERIRFQIINRPEFSEGSFDVLIDNSRGK